MLQASVGKTDKYIFCFFATRYSWLIFTKMRNDLKRHKTTFKRSRNNLKRLETTWNDLQHWNDLQRPEKTYNKQETTWNDLQQLRNNQQWPENICNEQKKTRNDQQQADFQIILQYGANGSLLLHFFHPTFGCNHSSIASRRIMVKIERQTFLYYHVYLLRDTWRTTLTVVN